MKINEIIDYLKGLAKHPVDESKTCDRIIIGNGENSVAKIGVSMFATPDVIREAHREGINLLVVHEPLCYDNVDKIVPYAIGNEKRKLLEEYGIAVFRFHDHAHNMEPDLIYDGQISNMGLCGTCERGKYWAVNRYVLEEP